MIWYEVGDTTNDTIAAVVNLSAAVDASSADADRRRQAIFNRNFCNDTEEDKCHGPHPFDNNVLTAYIYRYVSPPLVLVTLLTNCLVCIVLLKKSTRSPTNTLLVAMAVSDTLTGLWPLPVIVGFYSTGRYQDWIPYQWCFVYFCLTDYMPTVFHTASIWLTVCLAVQRYVYVCHPVAAKRHCTIRNSVNVVIGVYVAVISFQFCRFVESKFYPIELLSLLDNHTFITACYDEFAPFVKAHPDLYFNLYYWIRVVFVHFVPCISLVALNAILIHQMKAAAERRHQLLRQNRRAESRRLEESNSTTMMLVAVVGLFLLVEFPMAVFLITHVCNNTVDTPFISSDAITDLSLIINLFILLSYPLNFFIYCGMSRQFRDTFKQLFVCRPAPGDSTTAGNGKRPSSSVADGQHYVSLCTDGKPCIETNV